MRIFFDHSEQIAPNIWTFYIQPEKRVRYIAGQYAEFYLPHTPADSRGDHRWFTLSSSPSEEFLHVTTTFAEADGSSFKRRFLHMKPGTELIMTDPMGDFVLPKDPAIPIVFVAGGIGITPVRSMVSWLNEQNEQRPIQLLYAARCPEDLVFRKLFDEYPLNFVPVLTKAPIGWQGKTGPLNTNHIAQLAGDNAQKLFYFSGAEPMVEALVADLKNMGIERHQIVLDYFPGYTEF